ncbi:DUF1559 domain-containing protein [Blastopirellula sp. JC732]|uniref:DUF1559 domain-containing protein n=1 Tax=Blastopirellula sediminis TaxID=2894196 RepID=A0A9X1SG19_9BACT|nr:DUF1559 domain-containing protein [Blastopirellula sediminis]MCC9608305.1 DUF1559 domain-containing protein [Blastopirellula sediminis]MCC9628918.1 DUF1559 domain-containing protein [Blastopirellula sediminis]
MRTNRTLGFTLVELLVVIAIIGVLIGLLLPAVQQAREAARRMSCTNHLKQLALGLHNYHVTHGAFPIGETDLVAGYSAQNQGGWSWASMILPMIEQSAMYNSLDFRVHPIGNYSTAANIAATGTPLEAFNCPSDIKPETYVVNGATYATSSYMASWSAFDGTPCTESGGAVTVDLNRNNGMFVVNKSRSFRDLLDGTSNTFAIGEVTYIEIVAPAGGSERHFILGNVANNQGPQCYNVNNDYQSPINHMRSTRRKLNGPAVGGYLHRAFHSQHPGGANFAYADGSVHFIADTIYHTGHDYSSSLDWSQVGIYQRLSAIADGEPVGQY